MIEDTTTGEEKIMTKEDDLNNIYLAYNSNIHNQSISNFTSTSMEKYNQERRQLEQ